MPMMTGYVTASHSITGHRPQNEDSILVVGLGDDGLFMAVADGMGGQPHGDVASRTVMEGIRSFLLKNFAGNLKPANLKHVLSECFALAQYIIRKQVLDDPSFKGMGTTLTAMLVYREYYVYGNLGDSRLYAAGPDYQRQLTSDHTYVAEYMDRYRAPMSREFLLRYGQVLTKAVDGRLDEPDLYPENEPWLELQPGEIFLLCTDGLILDKSESTPDYISAEIGRSGTLQQAAESLVSYALDNGSTDNISVVLFRYAGEREKGEGGRENVDRGPWTVDRERWEKGERGRENVDREPGAGDRGKRESGEGRIGEGGPGAGGQGEKEKGNASVEKVRDGEGSATAGPVAGGDPPVQAATLAPATGAAIKGSPQPAVQGMKSMPGRPVISGNQQAGPAPGGHPIYGPGAGRVNPTAKPAETGLPGSGTKVPGDQRARAAYPYTGAAGSGTAAGVRGIAAQGPANQALQQRPEFAYPPQEKSTFPTKTLGIIAVILLAILAVLAVISIFDLNPFNEKEEPAGQRVIFDGTPVIKTNGAAGQQGKSVLFGAGKINLARDKYIRLLSRIIINGFNFKFQKEVVRDIRNFKPSFIYDLTIDTWDNLIASGVVPPDMPQAQAIAEQGLLVNATDSSKYLAIRYSRDEEGATDSLEYVSKSSMQFFTISLSRMISKFINTEYLAPILEPSIFYIVTYDPEGNLGENPLGFNPMLGSPDLLTVVSMTDTLPVRPRFVIYRNQPVIDITCKLTDRQGNLRIGLPW